jgi:hypothetical protein
LQEGATVSDRALYYPYIHIRDIEWLKATLLIFNQVLRMTPVSGPQADDNPILPFLQWQGGREPMLAGANLWSVRAEAAQVELARRLRKDANDQNFKNQFGSWAAATLRGIKDHGFQIHQGKLHPKLKEARV